MESYLKGVVPAEISASVAGGGHQGAGHRGPLLRRLPPATRTPAATTSTTTPARRSTSATSSRRPASERRDHRDGQPGPPDELRARSSPRCSTRPAAARPSTTRTSSSPRPAEDRGRVQLPARRHPIAARRHAPTTRHSPYDDWKTKTYTLAQVQAWFAADSRTNVGTLVKLDLRNRGVSGRLISVTLIGANGTTKKVSGDVFRSIFNAHRPERRPR